MWNEVNQRIRYQEKNRPASKKEARGAFLARLRHTAPSLPKSFNGALDNMTMQGSCTVRARYVHGTCTVRARYVHGQKKPRNSHKRI